MKIKSIPQSYGELASLYSEDLNEASKRTGLGVEDLLARVKESSFLEEFSKELQGILTLDGEDPIVLTSKESRDFLGVSQETWENLLSLMTGEVPHELPWQAICPNLTSGESVWDEEAVFWGPDIGRIGQFLDSFYPKHRLVRECSSAVKAFKSRLTSLLGEVPVQVPITNVQVSKVQLPAVPAAPASWPEGLPRDNKELVALYGADVSQVVHRICKIRSKEELEDVCQTMWINLIKAQILERFVQAAKTKLPRTMTLTDALSYLGITHQQWVTAVSRNKKDIEYWVPMPISGKRTSLDALYRTDDIKTLDTSDFLVNRRVLPRKRPALSARGFKSYLLKAVNNHFKNYLRTKSRRHQERTADPRSVFANDGAGVFHKVSMIEDGGSWEDSLSSSDISAEDMCDLVAGLKKHGIDPSTSQGLAILDYLSQGYRLKDAIKAQAKSVLRQKSAEEPVILPTG